MIKDKIEKCDTTLIECWKILACERVKRSIDKETISFRRGTKAIANLINTDTEVRERIINAIIDDDRWGRNKK